LDRFVRDPLVRDKGSTIFGKLALEFDRIASETSERVRRLETEVQRLVKEVETRDGRIVALTDELAYQDRRLSDLTDRHNHDISQRELEIRHLEGSAEQQRRAAVEQGSELARVKEMLRCEQDEHGRTSASLEATRHRLSKVTRALEQREEEVKDLQTELKGAVEKIELQATAAEHQVERLEKMLRDSADQELEAKHELAAGAGEREQMRLELARTRKDNERLRRQIDDLRRDLTQVKESWIQRTVATGEHSLKRVARQVPTLAGLFIRNLTNNAYMAVWQHRHNVRIFPGQ
jgi:chromosome segregation ATPase